MNLGVVSRCIIIHSNKVNQHQLTGGGYCSLWAPDDGHEDARNMLSCI